MPTGGTLLLPSSAMSRSASLPALITAPGDRAQTRYIEFFAAEIRNSNTRAYLHGRAVSAREGNT